jgi:hypothetical protein
MKRSGRITGGAGKRTARAVSRYFGSGKSKPLEVLHRALVFLGVTLPPRLDAY